MNLLLNSWRYYQSSFEGLSREIWWLSLVTFINRAGGMVIPFLSLYLTESLEFSFAQVGWIMTSFGIGAFVGSWIGGELTDKIGYYRVIVLSLILSAIVFIWISTLRDFWWICTGVFVVTTVTDAFRPAAYVAAGAYSQKSNYTRSITLIRLAINLGFSMGPAFGGLIISVLGYASLFYIDGATCLLAGLVIMMLLRPKSTHAKSEPESSHSKSVWKDQTYLIFLAGVFLFGLIFVQYFSVMPVYYHQAWSLEEWHIGWLLSFNGVLIFLTEMPLVKYLDSDKFSIFNIIIFSCVLLSLSFLVLEVAPWLGVVWIGIFLATVAEMMCFPFTNTFSLKRAGKGNEGRYMGYYTMAFSGAHIVGHNLGMNLSEIMGYPLLMFAIGMLALLCGFVFWIVKRRVQVKY